MTVKPNSSILFAAVAALAMVGPVLHLALSLTHHDEQGSRGQATAKATALPAAHSSVAGRIAGIWKGSVALDDTGICDLHLELIETAPSHFNGYSNFSCENAEPLMGPKHHTDLRSQIFNHINPDAAILSGTWENGAIRFHVDKTIGTDINGCVITSLTAVQFGSSQLAAEWQAGTCRGGSILLQRAKL